MLSHSGSSLQIRSTSDRRLSVSRVRRSAAVVVCAALACVAAPASAQIWNEPFPDAPELSPGDVTSGSGALVLIEGGLRAPGDTDLYAIRITDVAAFRASTVGGTALDTQLMLFNSALRGVVMNDDVSAGVTQSTITGALVPAAGIYYLAVTQPTRDASSSAGRIWNDAPATGERAPDGPGAAGALASWAGNVVTGKYTVTLVGAEFVTDTTLRCPPTYAISQPSSDASHDVAVGDVNRDGIADFVAPNRLQNRVEVRLGTGNGAFGPAQVYTTGANTNGVALGDFNRDGRLDFATANQTNLGQSLSISLGNGDGSFAVPTSLNVGLFATRVYVDDLNRDGRDDLVLAYANQSVAFRVLLGNGDGTFGAPTAFGTLVGNITLELGDFNRDGRTDVAAASATNGILQVFLGNGSGGFAAPLTTGMPTPIRSISSGDLNRDGKLDLVATSASTDAYFTLLGNGDGNFQAVTTTPTPNTNATVRVADLNADGLLDVFTGSSSLAVHLGNGNGSTQAPTITLISVFTAVLSFNVTDINGDGKADIVTAGSNGGSHRVLTQQPRGTPPMITTQPMLELATTGGPATYSVVAIGQGLTYQWRSGGLPLTNTSKYSGVTTATLVINPIDFIDEGSVYDCVVSNACGTVVTRPAGLKVENRCPGDFNEDGTIDFFDYLDYVAAFDTPCP
jgi:hypothetical protein